VNISEAVSLAVHGMGYLAARHGNILTIKEIADKLRASEAHLSKVFQRLARVGLVSSNRGPKGGYVLGRPSEEITLLDIYEAIEGPLKVNNCLFPRPICSGKTCVFGDLLETTNKRYQAYLEGMRLSELINVYGEDDTHAERDHQDRPGKV